MASPAAVGVGGAAAASGARRRKICEETGNVGDCEFATFTRWFGTIRNCDHILVFSIWDSVLFPTYYASSER